MKSFGFSERNKWQNTKEADIYGDEFQAVLPFLNGLTALSIFVYSQSKLQLFRVLFIKALFKGRQILLF